MPDNIRVQQSTNPADPLVASDEISTVHYQKFKIGWGPDGTWHETDDTNLTQVPIGGSAIGLVTEAAPASDTASSGLNGRLQRIAQRLSSLIALFPSSLGQKTMAGSFPVTWASDQPSLPVADGGGVLSVDDGGGVLSVDTNQLPATLGQKTVTASLAVALASDQGPLGATQNGTWTVQPGNIANTTRWKTDARQRAIVVQGTTLTRPANATPYTAGDLIANTAAAASVTAQSFAISDTNDAPVILQRMRLRTSDTGALPAVSVRAYLFAADPAANTGIASGDNAAFSVKQGNFIGSMQGAFVSFSDGAVAVLVPDQGQQIITLPAPGTTTIYALFVATTAFTPSANSTTFTPMLEGIQALA